MTDYPRHDNASTVLIQKWTRSALVTLLDNASPHLADAGPSDHSPAVTEEGQQVEEQVDDVEVDVEGSEDIVIDTE